MGKNLATEREIAERSEKLSQWLNRALRKMAMQPCSARDRRTWADAMALALFRKAIRGDVDAAREIADRVEGPVQQQGPMLRKRKR